MPSRSPMLLDHTFVPKALEDTELEFESLLSSLRARSSGPKHASNQGHLTHFFPEPMAASCFRAALGFPQRPGQGWHKPLRRAIML